MYKNLVKDYNYCRNADQFYNGFDISQVDSCYGLSNVDPDSREKLQKEWRKLAKTEEEIQALRQVLSYKVRQTHDLKRKLGITVRKGFREEMEQVFKNIQETSAYQKASGVVKRVIEKTTFVVDSFSASIWRKLAEVKNSDAFKSLKESL